MTSTRVGSRSLVVVNPRFTLLLVVVAFGATISNAETWMRNRTRALLDGYVGQFYVDEWVQMTIPELGEHEVYEAGTGRFG